MGVLSAVIKLSISGSVLALSVLLLRPVVHKKLPRVAMPVLWIAVLAAFLLPGQISSPVSVQKLMNTEQTQQAIQSTLSSLSTNMETTKKSAASNTANESAAQQAAQTTYSDLSENTEAVKTSSQTTEKTSASHSVSAGTILTAVWLAGAGTLVCYFALCQIRLHNRFQSAALLADDRYYQNVEGIRRQVRIYSSKRTQTALTYGLFAPKIILPEKLLDADDRTVRHVLLHEAEHIRHFDNLVSMLWLCLLCGEWFNPLVWICRRYARKDTELYCDAGVVKRLGLSAKADYARTILELTPVQGEYAAAMTFGAPTVKTRILSVMSYQAATVRSWCALAVLTAVLLTVCAPAASAVQATAKSTDSTNVVSTLLKEISETADTQTTVWGASPVPTENITAEYADTTGEYILLKLTDTNDEATAKTGYGFQLVGSYDTKDDNWVFAEVVPADIYHRYSFQLPGSSGSNSFSFVAAYGNGTVLADFDAKYLVLVKSSLLAGSDETDVSAADAVAALCASSDWQLSYIA